jgi:hypothetical protein
VTLHQHHRALMLDFTAIPARYRQTAVDLFHVMLT